MNLTELLPAGGLDALSAQLGIPRDQAQRGAQALLPSILAKVCPLPVFTAEDKAKIKRGCMYVAPPDHHLLVERNRMRVVRNFLLFHARQHPRTYIPDLKTFPRPSHPRPPRLVTPAEVADTVLWLCGDGAAAITGQAIVVACGEI